MRRALSLAALGEFLARELDVDLDVVSRFTVEPVRDSAVRVLDGPPDVVTGFVVEVDVLDLDAGLVDTLRARLVP